MTGRRRGELTRGPWKLKRTGGPYRGLQRRTAAKACLRVKWPCRVAFESEPGCLPRPTSRTYVVVINVCTLIVWSWRRGRRVMSSPAKSRGICCAVPGSLGVVGTESGGRLWPPESTFVGYSTSPRFAMPGISVPVTH